MDVSIVFVRKRVDIAINYLAEKQSDAEELKKAVEKETSPQNIREEETLLELLNLTDI